MVCQGLSWRDLFVMAWRVSFRFQRSGLLRCPWWVGRSRRVLWHKWVVKVDLVAIQRLWVSWRKNWTGLEVLKRGHFSRVIPSSAFSVLKSWPFGSRLRWKSERAVCMIAHRCYRRCRQRGFQTQELLWFFFIVPVFWYIRTHNGYLQDFFVCSNIDFVFQLHWILILSKSQQALDLLRVFTSVPNISLRTGLKVYLPDFESWAKFCLLHSSICSFSWT